MNNTLLLVLSLLIIRSCGQKPVPKAPPLSQHGDTARMVQDSLPTCLLQRIDSIRKAPVWSPPAEITEYVYKDRTVYLVTADCCDQFTTLIDKNCQTLCAPTGGFTGRGDGKCPDFRDSARMVKVVWKDDR